MHQAHHQVLKLFSSERSRIVDAIQVGKMHYEMIREGVDRDVYIYTARCPYTGVATIKQVSFTYSDRTKNWERSAVTLPNSDEAFLLPLAA